MMLSFFIFINTELINYDNNIENLIYNVRGQKVIDFEHSHYGIKPHIHYNLNHEDKGIPLTQGDLDLIEKIKRRL